MKMKVFYCHIDSLWWIAQHCIFDSTLTSLSLLFGLFLYICNAVELEFSVQNGGRATEVPPSGCYPKSISVSSLGLLYSLDILRRRGAPDRIQCNRFSTKQLKSTYKEVQMARLPLLISIMKCIQQIIEC